jgi:phosphate-selective porin
MRYIAAAAAVLMMTGLMAVSAWAGGQSVSGALAEALYKKGVLDDASYGELKKAEGEGGEQALNKKLIETLHAKGILDDESYNKLARQVEEQPGPVAVAAPQSSPSSAKPGESDRPFDKALSSVEEGFARLSGDTVKLKIGTWTQLGFVNDNVGSNTGALPGPTSFVANSGNQFYIRYARLYFNGTLSDKVGFRVMADASSGTPLRDAYVWMDYIPYTRVTLGQFLTPWSDETWRAPFDLPMINYSMAANLMQFPNFRDIGLMASSKYSTKVGGLPVGGGYSMALINGNNINAPDNNDSKDFLGRAWVNPFVPGLSVGGSWYVGKTTNGVGRVQDDKSNTRWGVELDYAPDFAKGLAIRGEYLSQRKWLPSNNQNVTGASALYNFRGNPAATPAARALVAADNRYYHAYGWYTSALYRLNGFDGGMKFLNDLEPTFRYDFLDEDTAIKENSRDRFTMGLNYWLNKYTRVLANYELFSADGGLKTRAMMNTNNFGHSVFTTNVQIWF